MEITNKKFKKETKKPKNKTNQNQINKKTKTNKSGQQKHKQLLNHFMYSLAISEVVWYS